MKKNYTFLQTILCICLMVFGSIAYGQSINFTIDTAIDNGTSITETIVVGPDTFVLTVFHSGNEELDNLGGGDLIFFLSAIDPLTPFRLTITKNGNPTNFRLNSIDYDTLGAGTISVANQDDAIISAPTSYPVGFGSLIISNPTNAFDITEIKIIPTGVLDLNNFGFHNINIDILDTLSIETSIANDALAIFPNPTQDYINISSNSTISALQIFDITGKQVFQTNTVNETVDVSFLNAGIYLVKMQGNNVNVVKKLIKK